MTKNKKTILYVILALALTGGLCGGGYAYYAFVYCQNHRTTPADMSPDMTLNATDLLTQVEADWIKAGKTSAIPTFMTKDGGKIIQTTGIIASKNETSGSVTINLLGEAVGINCTVDSVQAVKNKAVIGKLKVGDNITIEGRCAGFDYDEESFEIINSASDR